MVAHGALLLITIHPGIWKMVPGWEINLWHSTVGKCFDMPF